MGKLGLARKRGIKRGMGLVMLEFDAPTRSIPRRRQPLPKIAAIALASPPCRTLLTFKRCFKRPPQPMIVNSRELPAEQDDAVRIVLVGGGVAELGAGPRKKCKCCRIRVRSEPVHFNGDGLHSGKIGLIHRHGEPQYGEQPLSHLLGLPFLARHYHQDHQAATSCRSGTDEN